MPASLLSAKIRGLRSYSPYEHKTQYIEFMPLTLIVGSNGSGKTTLIECLKFMISGEEPPLSDSRRNFLHTSKNPKDSYDKKTSYASIELAFQNSRDENCLAKREIARDTSGKNIAPAISSSYKIANKPWTNINKQDDWNKTVPLLFNLPNQAILNNVVLCHQDDNLWCMGDSSTVKQIFDKIFGCEQYKREIKYIETEIKSCQNDLSICERDVLLHREKISTKKNFENKLDDFAKKVTGIDLKTKDLDSELDKFIEEKVSTSGKILNIETKLRHIEAIKSKVKDLESMEMSVRESLREPPIDPNLMSDDDLRQKVVDHDTKIEEIRTRQTEMKVKESELRKEIDALEAQNVSLQNLISNLKVVELKSRESHNNLMKGLEAIKVEQSLDAIDTKDIEGSLNILEKSERELIQKKSDNAETEDDLSKKQLKLSRSITSLEGLCGGLTQKIKVKESFVKKLSDQLAQTDPVYQDLTSLTANLDKMSLIIRQMPKSEQVISLDNLVNKSTIIVDNLVIKINNDSVVKLTTEIEKENSEIESGKKQLENLESQKGNLSIQQQQVDDDYSKIRTASKDAHNKVVTFKSARLNLHCLFQSYQGEVKILEKNDMSSKLDDLEKLKIELGSKKSQINSLSAEQTGLSDIIRESFERYEAIKNNIHIRNLASQVEKFRSEISSSETNSDEVDQLPELRNRLSNLVSKELGLRDTRSKLAGSKTQILREIKLLESDLTRYSTVDIKYSENLGKIVCNKIIINDLEKLKECFHQSITSFHNHMLTKINEVLRVRWRQIYRGSDIDLIELVDEKITKGKDKKSSNYYLAMRKGGIKMKMREKSSAGQKALASIILRMTLAELFVKDFAFIALDEPTCNLDLAHVESLARAIGNYVKKRTEKGVNIQWIIITHDEQFLKALDAECSPYYYRVQLDDEGCSKIVKISYQDYKPTD